MPKSSIGHYVGTMPQLMGLAIDQLVQENTDYAVSLDPLALDADKVTEMLCTTVPMSERRRQMSGVWLLLASQSGADPEVAEVLHRLNASIVEGLTDLLRGMQQQGLLHPARRVETEVHRLHALIDGMSLQRMTDPELLSDADVRAILRDEVGRLAEPTSALVR